MGGRFYSLDQTHLACESTLGEDYVIPSPKLNEDQTKRSSPTEYFSLEINFSPQFGTYYVRLDFVGFIHAGWLFFVWSSRAQISMGRHLNLNGGL